MILREVISEVIDWIGYCLLLVGIILYGIVVKFLFMGERIKVKVLVISSIILALGIKIVIKK